MSDSPGEGIKIISQNKRAFHDYVIEKKYEAGIELVGSEVKSCRDSKVQLVDSYAAIERGELYLYKALISEFAQGGPYFNHIPTRKRKLLMHKKEIKNLHALTEQKGYTLVPLKMYFKKGRAKIEIGLAKGKTKGDKRQSLKDRQDSRNMDRAIRRNRS
jgi:SsrA-binding protein